MKKIRKTSLILSSILLIFTGCSNKENKQSNNVENQSQDNNKTNENTEKKDTVLVKNYVISEEGRMIDVEVEYKNNIAQKMTQLFVNKPISELTQNEKFKFDDVIESMQSTEAKEKIIEESKGLKLIAKEENNNLTIKAILDLNEIYESDAKNESGLIGKFKMFVANLKAEKLALQKKYLEAADEYIILLKEKELDKIDRQNAWYQIAFLYANSKKIANEKIIYCLTNAINAYPESEGVGHLKEIIKTMEKQ